MLRERTRNRPTHYNSRYKDSLSPRERDVLSLLSKGQTNAQIADNLGVGFETVKWHVTGILGKLAVDSREEAATIWNYDHSLRGRAERTWSALIGIFTTKAAAITGASVAVVAAAAIGVIAIALSLNGTDETVSPDSAAELPRVGSPVPLPAGGGLPLVRAGSSLFVPTTNGLAYFDATTGASGLVADTTRGPLGASLDGQIWTKGAGTNSLVHVDPATRTIAKEVSLPFPVDDTTFVLADANNVWVSFWTFDAVVKLSVASGEVQSTTTLSKPKGATLAGGHLWVPLARTDAVAKLDPGTMEVLAEIPLGTAKDNANCGGCVTWVYAAGDSVWAISTMPGQVTRIDAATGKVVGTALLPGKLLAGFEATAEGDAWVPVTAPGTVHGDLVRIDHDTVREVERVGLGQGKGMLDAVSPQGIREVNGTLWVSTEQGELIPVRATQ